MSFASTVRGGLKPGTTFGLTAYDAPGETLGICALAAKELRGNSNHRNRPEARGGGDAGLAIAHGFLSLLSATNGLACLHKFRKNHATRSASLQ